MLSDLGFENGPLCTDPRFFPHNEATLFRLRDVGVSFGRTSALKNIHLDIDRGEILFVTGASGAGKTTLLGVLAGDIEPTMGSCMGYAENFFCARVFQDLRMIPDISIGDNLMLSFDSKLYGSRRQFLSDLLGLVKILGFEDKLDLKTSLANGGLKQKAASVRALLSRPDIFLADEPSSSLDFESAKKLFELLSLYNAKKAMTVVWASHNRELIKQFAGRIVHLDGGKLVYSGHACRI